MYKNTDLKLREQNKDTKPDLIQSGLGPNWHRDILTKELILCFDV